MAGASVCNLITFCWYCYDDSVDSTTRGYVEEMSNKESEDG